MLDTFDGDVAIGITPNGVMVDSANVIQADVDASNGVIHAVDSVLVPAGFTEQLQARLNAPDTASESATTANSSATTAETQVTRTSTTATTESEDVAAPQAAPSAPAAPQQPVRGLW
ncbi:MAG: fasciclin domain-containing protein [Cyanobacteria bacterium J06649_4]